MNQCIEVPASHAGVLRLIAFADEVEQRDPLSFDQSYLLRLVIEEIATNIVKYGYPQDAPGVIQLQCVYDDGLLRVIIRDHGRPFDPREHPDPDMGDDLGHPADRRAGPVSGARIGRRSPVSSRPRQRLERAGGDQARGNRRCLS